MLATVYKYSLLNAGYITLADGEVMNCMDAVQNSQVYGVFVYNGTSTVIDTEGNNLGQSWGQTDSFRPNDINCGVKVQATGETTWLCVSQNDDVRREVQELKVDGSATLPAGWAFLVLDGSVQADGKTANQFQFFRPRDTDIEVQGSGALLLVR